MEIDHSDKNTYNKSHSGRFTMEHIINLNIFKLLLYTYFDTDTASEDVKYRPSKRRHANSNTPSDLIRETSLEAEIGNDGMRRQIKHAKMVPNEVVGPIKDEVQINSNEVWRRLDNKDSLRIVRATATASNNTLNQTFMKSCSTLSDDGYRSSGTDNSSSSGDDANMKGVTIDDMETPSNESGTIVTEKSTRQSLRKSTHNLRDREGSCEFSDGCSTSTGTGKTTPRAKWTKDEVSAIWGVKWLWKCLCVVAVLLIIVNVCNFILFCLRMRCCSQLFWSMTASGRQLRHVSQTRLKRNAFIDGKVSTALTAL